MRRRHAPKPGLSICLAAACLACSGTVALAADANVDGRNVAATCATCHGTNGASVSALPSLAGVPREDIVAKMRAFKAGTQPGTLMPQLAKGYTDEQIERAAAFFAAQPARRP